MLHHTGTVSLHTSRLLLRPLYASDAPQMYRHWASDPAVTRYLRWEPHSSAAATRQLLTAWAELYANPDYYQWGIVEAASGALIGSISLFDSTLQEAPEPQLWQTPGLDFSAGIWEPGYCIGRRWWNQGYTTEALRAVAAHWFSAVGGSWLACSHALANPASGRVMQKAGFLPDHVTQYHKFDGTPVPCRIYRLTRAEWAARYRP